MLLVVDVGNTNITFGVFDAEKSVYIFRAVSDKNLDSENYKQIIKKECRNFQINKCIIVSVVEELSIVVKTACDEVFEINSYLFGSDSKTGIYVDVIKPELVGADRIANALAASKLYSTPCIVIDSGSATTFDIISSDKRFFGGIIMPGIAMQLSSLSEKTSKLPKIEIEEVDNVIGVDTKTCILSGVIRGHVCAIEGLIQQCEEEIGQKATIIATGGLSKLLSKYMKRKFDDVNPNLTLYGIKFLYDVNNL